MSERIDPQINLIQAALQPGEKLRWMGREPHSRYLLHRLSRLAMYTAAALLAGLWAAIRIAAEPDFLHSPVLESLPVLLPLLLAGLGSALLARELFFPGKSGPDAYAVTDRRAVVVTPGRKNGCCFYPAESLGSLQVRRNPGGSGDIVFEHGSHWSTDPAGRAMWQWRQVGFFGLARVDEVYRLLTTLDREIHG